MRELCALRAVEDWLAATDEQLEPGSPLFPKMRGEVIYPEAMSLRTLDLLRDAYRDARRLDLRKRQSRMVAGARKGGKVRLMYVVPD